MGTVYDELKEIHGWQKYFPLDDKYYLYTSNVIFACCKISDLYYQMCNARMGLHFYCDYDRYEMSGEDDISILNSKKYFLENALLYYNFSIDYLWQVLWLYYNNSDDIYKLATNERYQKEMKSCNFDALLCGLSEIRERKIVEVLKDNFTERNELYKEIRERYNMLKHRAVFHTPGLGMNNEISMYPFPVTVETKEDGAVLSFYHIPLIVREELDLEVLKELLIKFDKQFVKVCEYFFELIVPESYLESNKVKVRKIEEYYTEHIDELEKYSKKHPEIVKHTPCQVFLEEIKNE